MAERPDRRGQLLDVATALFQQHGFAGVGVDRITSEVGVGAMTLYRAIGNKDDLITAVLERWSAQWQQWLTQELASRPGTARQRLVQLFDILQEWFAAEDYRGSLVEYAAVELRGRPEHPAQQVIAAHRAWLRRLLEQLATDAGVEDPVEATAELDVAVQGAIVRASASEGPRAAASARALASRLTRPGLAADG